MMMFDFATLQAQFNAWTTAVVAYLPNLIAAILLLIIGSWLTSLLTRLLGRGLARLGFDELVSEAGLSRALTQAKLTQKPSELVGRLIYWLILLNLILIALRVLGLDLLADPLAVIISYLPQLFMALVLVVGGFIVAQFVGRLVQATLDSMGIEFSDAVGQMVQILLIIMVIILSLQVVGLDVTLFAQLLVNFFTIMVAGVALAFGLGGRDIARNVLAGYYAREMFRVGDAVLVGEQEGVLIGIGTINCELLLGQERLILPNTSLTEGEVKIKLRGNV
jgi:small-conductance mechanosensitive channel